MNTILFGEEAIVEQHLRCPEDLASQSTKMIKQGNMYGGGSRPISAC